MGASSAGAWQIYRVPEHQASFESADPLLAGWDDLEERERRLGLHPGHWFLINAGSGGEAALLAFFRDPVFARKAADTQESYARDLKVHFEFLSAKGKTWRDAAADDFADYEFWRRRDEANPGRVSGAKFNREVAACRLFYEWQVRQGAIESSPVVLAEVRQRDGSVATVPQLRSTDVRSTRVNWLTPRAYRRWRDVGLGGYSTDGMREPSWRGRSDGRNLAFADLLWTSGLRLREAGTLLTWELPPRDSGRAYMRGRVGDRVAKGSGRWFWLSSAALAGIDAYVASTRAEAVRRAQDEMRYAELRGIRIATSVNRRRELSYVDERGAKGKVSLDALGVAERMRLYVEGNGGPEPLWLWLGESGLPMAYRSWEAAFAGSNARCKRLGVPIHCHPHMLRHSFALRMLVTLQHLFDRRLGLTPEERKEYRHLFGDPWVMVKELLGHRSIDTTKDIYLEPATGLQIDLLLNGDPEDADLVTSLLSRLAAESPRMIDLESDD